MLVFQAMRHTPFWVYIILFYIIYAGLKASKNRTVPIYKLFIGPLIFSILSFHSLFTVTQVNLLFFIPWFFAIVCGGMFGFWQISLLNIVINKSKRTFQIPGTYMTLVLFMIIFCSKYYHNFELAVNPQIANKPLFVIIMLSLAGVSTGITIGQLICFMHRYKNLGVNKDVDECSEPRP